MKKVLAVCSALLATTSFAMAGHHEDPTMLEGLDMQHFYVGGDIGYVDLDYDPVLAGVAEDSLPVFNIYMGYELDEMYAIEFGAFMTTKEGYTAAGTTTDTEEYGVFVDAVAKYGFYEDFTAIGTAGLQFAKLKAQSSTTDFSENELAPRLGAGIEYKLTDDMNVRGMMRYAFSDYDGAADYSVQYTIGMNYKF